MPLNGYFSWLQHLAPAMQDFFSIAQHPSALLSEIATKHVVKLAVFSFSRRLVEDTLVTALTFSLSTPNVSALWWQLCLILLVPGSRGHLWLCGGSRLPNFYHCWHTSLNKFLIILPVTPLFTGLDPDKHLFIKKTEAPPPPTICRLSCNVLASHRCRDQWLPSQLWH